MRDFANAMEGGWLRRRAAEFSLSLALGPAFAWLSPFGLEEPAFFARVGFWTGVTTCWFVVVALTEVWLAWLGRGRVINPRTRYALLIGLAALPMVAIAGGAIELLKGWQPSVPEVTELYLQVVVLGSLTLFLAREILPGLLRPQDGAAYPADRRPPAPALPETALPETALPALTSPVHGAALMVRLPAGIRGPLVCLEMQDHYVRVHTERGAALVLMRLRDAIAETAPAAGRQVHRSWWVADRAVERCARTGRAGTVRLTNGLAVPVSQRYLREVEAAYGADAREPAGVPASG
ncbi:LytTR family transcriptional regulator [Ancylobacter dichloromethanicus]|nr:LytTR family DNA-binding domain-containing protein [Ancylobacter dichloromethanicus]MBS7553648.1 LytTR family transcriptional regulator [Ancylobacter dichloromethanicus]